MPDVLIRNLSDKTLTKLKKRAKQNKRSLQAELQAILEREVPVDREELAARVRRQLGGRVRANTTDLLREDRDR